MDRIFLPIILILSLITCCIEMEISAPSFVDITKYFATNETLTSQIIALNLVGFCIASAIYGPLSDCYGRRKVMIIGNSLMMIGAIICAFSPSISILLFGRFIQGLGAATSAVVAFAMIADKYDQNTSTKLIAIMNAIFTSFMAIAPVIGGFLNGYFGFRGNFAFVAILSTISWLLLYFKLPETKIHFEPLDLQKIKSDYKKLLSSSLFLTCSFIPSALYGSYMVFVSMAPFIYMINFKTTIFAYSLHQGIIVFSYALTSIVTDKIINHLGRSKAIKASLVIMLCSSCAMIFASTHYFMTISMSMFCIGFAIIYPIIFTYSLEIFSEIKGTASSAIMCSRALICAFLVSIASYFYNNMTYTIGIIISLVNIIIILLTIINKVIIDLNNNK